MTMRALGAASDVLVVGGGIAGLAAAYHLARERVGRVRLLEREPLLASHSSGRNAGMFRHLENTKAPCWLAARSRDLLDELLGGRDAWLRPTGGLFVGGCSGDLAQMAENAQYTEVKPTWVNADELAELVPALRGTEVGAGLFSHGDGVIDIHRVTDTLARAARHHGARIDTGVQVRSVLTARGRISGVGLTDGTEALSPQVVIAGGAWSAALGASCGAPLDLVPKRRHLVQLGVDAELAASVEPIVWRVDDDEIYFRPESGGLLASPCDERVWEPCIPPPDDDALVMLAEKLMRLAPGIAHADVRRPWACLRTFAPDRLSVVGSDPRVQGLYWLAALGGHGITTATAEGELLAAVVCGRAHPLADELSPSRLLEDATPVPLAAVGGR